MKIDLHVHIKRRSSCAMHETEQMAEKACKRGIDGIVILDHNYFPTEEECKRVQKKFPNLKIFKGTEITFINDNGDKEDLVIVAPSLPSFPWSDNICISPGLSQLAKYLENIPSLTILAHPFRKHVNVIIDFNTFVPDCVEIASINTPKKKRKDIYVMAKKYGMRMVSVSDAHKDNQLGNYCIDLLRDVNNEIELISAVKSYEYVLLEKKLAPVNLI